MLRLFVRVARSRRGAVPAAAGKVCCGAARWLPGSGRRLAVAAAVGVVAAVAAAPSALAGVPGWVIQASANPPGTSAGELLSVSCPSAADCLAVGYNMTPDYAYNAFAESWDGATSTWTIVSPVLPPAAALSMLTGVSCTSAAACTAVGSYETSGGVIYPLAELWNGTSWRLQNALSPAGSTYTVLNGVSCTSAVACVAVGASKDPATGTLQDLAETWDGRYVGGLGILPHWTIQRTQAAFRKIDYGLNAVSCASASDCLAVGQYVSHLGSTDSQPTWAEHWNGTSWTGVFPDVASSSYNTLDSVSCTSATACTAVGSYRDSSGITFPLAERWNGTSWALQSPAWSAIWAGARLGGVSCASATACTAVGTIIQAGAPAYPARTLAESWDGSSWTAASTRDPATATQSSLGGVSCPSAAVCTAVGTWDAWTPSTSGFYSIYTLAERYS
ncbi:MAG TPA: hypothetical protein VGR98_00125 [Streptosporangiaceae bacterium]|nr:hypothetical protein [Streptosporangiaceae bacterium]